jgi:hypothetical protein
MEESTDKKPMFSRPQDQSWQAYRGWIMELTSHLTGKKADDPYTAAEWEQEAKMFWAGGKPKEAKIEEPD